MNTQQQNEELMDIDQVKLLLESQYGLEETEMSKTEIALFHKMMEINSRIKRLEDHLLVSVIQLDMEEKK